MRYLKYVALLGILLFAANYAQAQVSVGIGIGPVYGERVYVPPPACPYGYYDYYPYDCAPYGYYGPNYFVRGVFIGVGPWYRGHWDRDRYWGDRDRFERARGWGDRDGNRFGHDRGYFSPQERGHGFFDRGRGDRRGDSHFVRGRGGDSFHGHGGNHFDQGHGGGFFHGRGRGDNRSGHGNRGRGRHH
ncbi:MAG TPA: hypothetical protein VGR93_03505 [Candidatus Acidoferrales bacterium]|nr:hypothetical protein [Candidatus Acidoferrales bacterium]